MKALTYERHGDPRDGVVKKVFDPRPGPGQLLVRVVAAALNPADWKIVEGKAPFLLLPRRPFVPGCEAAGVVEAMDSRVAGFHVGDEVVVSTGLGGALAEKAAVSALHAVRKPGNLSFEEAAGIPAAGQSALQGLRDAAGLCAGRRLLVNGAGGGIGHVGRAVVKGFDQEHFFAPLGVGPGNEAVNVFGDDLLPLRLGREQKVGDDHRARRVRGACPAVGDARRGPRPAPPPRLRRRAG